MAKNASTQLRFLREIYNDRPGSQTMHAFNRSLERAGVERVVHQPTSRHTNIARHLDDKGLLRNFIQTPGKAYIVALMWPKTARFFPVGYFRELIPLCFDCWPADYDKWEEIFTCHKVKIAFFTARQSQRYFQKKLPEMKSYWLAEACDPEEYPFTAKLTERSIDVLELGRRMESYHDAIVDQLRDAGINHVYLKKGQQRLFPSSNELMDGWADTKISVCYPKSATSEEWSGGLETVTFRYFESMASRCLIVGHCPAELQQLFGYNPVIEADNADPAKQLLTILQNIADYQPLVEKNHKRLLEVGSWDARTEEMLDTLISNGYSL